MKNIFPIVLLFGIISCSNPTVSGELKTVQDELSAAKTKIEKLKSQIEPEGDLVHIVYFKTKPGADLMALGKEIEKLEAIEVVKDLQYGPFTELGDARALSDYTMMMEMSFDSELDYQKYQKHPIHLKLKENAKTYLVAPPATYDYLKK